MAVLPYASLSDVRSAIRSRRIVRFYYRKTLVVAEPYLLGNFRKTHALVLNAWKTAPEEGWELFRFSEMRDVEILAETFASAREGFNPHDPRVISIDTSIRLSR